MYPSKRPGSGKEQMDDLGYQYQQNPQGYLANNRLTQVTDAVEAVRYTMDIDHQGANNYGYDAIGNLVRDDAEKILNISWTVYGKIASIQKDNGLISYRYDAAGNRVYKESTMGGGLQKTWYVRDAQGNTLAVYNESGSSGVTWAEQHLYGSSRLGYWQIGLPKSSSLVSAWNDEGGRLYELSNHLGNVMAVVRDKAPDGQKNAELVRLQDYYAFGMEIPGRRSIFEGSSYRYGFNGQEKSTEINGDGNSYTAEFWQYDARLGRRWNIDPKPTVGVSSYAAFLGNPILYADPLGDTSILEINTARFNVTQRDIQGAGDAFKYVQAHPLSFDKKPELDTKGIFTEATPLDWKYAPASSLLKTIGYGTAKLTGLADLDDFVMRRMDPANNSFEQITVETIQLSLSTATLRGGPIGPRGRGISPELSAGQIDLVGFRSEHILNRHGAGAGKAGKTEFPSTWSDQKVITEVNNIANSPHASGGVGPTGPYKTHFLDGLDIRVDFYPTNHPRWAGKVSTAYPTNVPANPPRPPLAPNPSNE